MPLTPALGAIVGLDGFNPMYDENGLWRTWLMSEIFLGKNAQGKYIPKIQDHVVENIGNKIYRYIVVDINWETGIAVLARESTNAGGDFSAEDTLVGIGAGTPATTYLAYVDKSVTPYRLTVDQRCFVPGSMVRYCKIFKGSLLTNEGVVVSRVYDGNGQLVSEDIPMEKAGVITVNGNTLVENTTIKTIRPAHTTHDLKQGEYLTAVFYDDSGIMVSKRQLLVEISTFIKTPDNGTKYVTGISMRSPFISATDESVIRYPQNVPLSGLNLIGVVHYSNGDTREYPVDGSRFKLLNFDTYVASQPGQTFEAVLTYTFGENEFNYVSVMGGDNHTARVYQVQTMPADATYGVKLFAYPVWIDAISGYKLEWFLYNLKRDVAINVTPYVVINTGMTPWNPLAYGQLQTLSVSINLKRADARYRNYAHTQVISFVIERQGTERLTNWSIAYSPGQSPMYGPNLWAGAYFLGTNRFRINLKSDCTTQTEWVARVYGASQPLLNPSTEVNAPAPTHFAVYNSSGRTLIPIDQWDKDLTINAAVTDSGTLFIQFVRVVGQVELELAVCGLPVYYVDANGDIVI